MTESLGKKLLGDKIQETDPCANDHGCESTPRYIRFLFRS